MSRLSRWLPEMARSEPDRTIALAYQVPAAAAPTEVGRRVSEALNASSLTTASHGENVFRTSLPWRTRVFGVITRDVDEEVTFRLVRRPDLWELVVRCHPVATHDAHATGIAAVLFVAVTVWIVTGLVSGVAAALTTVLAGALLVEVTRQWALDALERRLRRLTADVGTALWPGVPAQIVDAG